MRCQDEETRIMMREDRSEKMRRQDENKRDGTRLQN